MEHGAYALFPAWRRVTGLTLTMSLVGRLNRAEFAYLAVAPFRIETCFFRMSEKQRHRNRKTIDRSTWLT